MPRRVKCCAPGCFNVMERGNFISFFKFPSEPTRCYKWLRFCGLEDKFLSAQDVKSHMRICEDHFQATDRYAGEKTRLCTLAVPTIHSNGIVVSTTIKSESPLMVTPPATISPPPSPHYRHKFVRTYARSARVDSVAECTKISPPPPCLGGVETLPSLNSTFLPDFAHVVSNSEAVCSLEKSSPVKDESISHNAEISSEVSSPFTLIGYRSGVIDYVKQELCRVCGCEGDTLISIFENSTMKNTYNISVVKVLEMYLPLKILEDDNLPSKICSKCLYMINQWHEFYITCVAANASFQSMYCQGNLEGDRGELVTRLPEEVVKLSVSDESSMENPVLKMEENVNVNDYLKIIKSDDNVEHSDNCEDKICENKVTGEEEKIKYCELQRYQHPKLCRYCGDLFYDRNSWRSHFEVCKESLTICEACGKIICRKYLQIHKCQYHGTKKLCDKCGEKFYPRFLSSHLRSHYSETYYCNLCWKIFKTKSGHQQHIIRHKIGQIKTAYKVNTRLKEDKMVFVCPVCYLSFHNKRSLILHLNQSKLVMCPVCRLQLNNEKLLYLHKCKMLTHSQSFFEKTLLMRHVQIHTRETP